MILMLGIWLFRRASICLNNFDGRSI